MKRSDVGSAVPFLALTVVAIMALTASLVYASARVRAYLRARDIAHNAAEAGAQQLDQDALHAGILEINPTAAVREVAAYLAAVDSKGRVTVIGSSTAPSSCGLDTRVSPPAWRTCIRVEVEERFGLGEHTVRATGTARPVAGVKQEEP